MYVAMDNLLWVWVHGYMYRSSLPWPHLHALHVVDLVIGY